MISEDQGVGKVSPLERCQLRTKGLGRPTELHAEDPVERSSESSVQDDERVEQVRS